MRVSRALLERIDAVRAETEAALLLPVAVSRSAVIRQLLEEALDARDRRRAATT